LVVVIAIISLLVAILVPMLSKAREAARRAICASNQRQIAAAAPVYAADFQGRLPGAGYQNYRNRWINNVWNRGTAFYFVSQYLDVPLRDYGHQGGSPRPPEVGHVYGIKDLESVMYCPSNETNGETGLSGDSAEINPDYLLRGFGVPDDNDGAVPGGVYGYPRYEALTRTKNNHPKVLVQDMIYKPAPCSLTDNLRYMNHKNQAGAEGGNVAFGDGSVRWGDAKRFHYPGGYCNRAAIYKGGWNSFRANRNKDWVVVNDPPTANEFRTDGAMLGY
jgi:prepilin-type processing-associated H-X9-DG protein